MEADGDPDVVGVEESEGVASGDGAAVGVPSSRTDADGEDIGGDGVDDAYDPSVGSVCERIVNVTSVELGDGLTLSCGASAIELVGVAPGLDVAVGLADAVALGLGSGLGDSLASLELVGGAVNEELDDALGVAVSTSLAVADGVAEEDGAGSAGSVAHRSGISAGMSQGPLTSMLDGAATPARAGVAIRLRLLAITAKPAHAATTGRATSSARSGIEHDSSETETGLSEKSPNTPFRCHLLRRLSDSSGGW